MRSRLGRRRVRLPVREECESRQPGQNGTCTHDDRDGGRGSSNDFCGAAGPPGSRVWVAAPPPSPKEIPGHFLWSQHAGARDAGVALCRGALSLGITFHRYSKLCFLVACVRQGRSRL